MTLRIAPGLELPDDVVGRLWAKVDSSGGPDDCWPWTGYQRNGYGSIWAGGQNIYTHRLALAIARGPLEANEEACHTCDNPPCCNPAHLFAAPHVENVSDMLAKGRGSKPPRQVGIANHNATLNIDQVGEIRAAVERGDRQRDVAARFLVSQSTVWRIAHGVTRAVA